MCGIVGGWARNAESARILADAAPTMLRSVAHRGRDGSGLEYFRFGSGPIQHTRHGGDPSVRLVLGHVRLAVIDTSDAGLQPMASDDGRQWITFNGEIYNFVELRRELEEKGHAFRSATDTEVMLAAYREYGVDFVKRLNGMFAFALLDTTRHTLLLARDPLGIKPLYYRHDASHGLLVFGSEIKAILASGLYDKQPDWPSAYHYFTFLYAPNPSTLFRGIQQLEPAHTLELDLESGEIRFQRYWHPRHLPEIASLSATDLHEALKRMLSEAVGRQMRSDVPIGSFLSGGVDSTVVTGLMTQHSNRVQTYTVTFPEDGYDYYDEAALARATARLLGTEHHELPIRLNEPQLIFELIDHFDQPFGNPTYYLMYLISREARRHITVALCGAGGDELFGGYPRYRAMGLASFARWLPTGLLQGLARGIRWLPDAGHGAGRRRVQSFFAGLDRDQVHQYMKWTYYLSDAEKAKILHFPESAREASRQRFRRLYEVSELPADGNRLLELDVHSFLVDNLLEYTDKMSMAVPLEMRVPILDHDFVEFSLNVPFHAKLRRGETKLPLKRAFRDYFTPESLTAPKKGFIPPLAEWMRDRFDAYFDGRLETPGRAPAGVTWKLGLLEGKVIERYRAEHRQGIQDRSYELFGIMIYDYWYRQHFA